MLTPRQADFASTFVATLLGGAGVIVIFNTGWSLAAKVMVSLLVSALFVVVLLLWNGARRRMRRQRSLPPAPAPPKPAIERGWFVTFSDDPDPAGGGTPQYAVAIAEVDAVEDGSVVLNWRDKGNFPKRVPIALLEADRVGRYRRNDDGSMRTVNSDNAGVRFSGVGGMAVGNGWSAHRSAPQVPYRRFRSLDDAEQAAMEADADLSTYDINNLKPSSG